MFKADLGLPCCPEDILLCPNANRVENVGRDVLRGMVLRALRHLWQVNEAGECIIKAWNEKILVHK